MYLFYIILSLLTLTSMVRTMPFDDTRNEIVESTTKKLHDPWVIFFYDKDPSPSISRLSGLKTYKQDGEPRIDTRLDPNVRNLTRDTLLAPLLRTIRSTSIGTTATIIAKLIEQLRNIGSKFAESLDFERFCDTNATRFENNVKINDSILSNETARFFSDRITSKLILPL